MEPDGHGMSWPRDPAMPPTTFHWEIEFPEVFTRPKPGFDAFVGNPPFRVGAVCPRSYYRVPF